MTNDGDLRRRFQDLSREDATRAGDFHAFLRRPRSQTASMYVSRRIAVATAAAVAVIVVLLARWPARRGVEIPVISITEWKSPTDFLLQTPGEEVWRTVPKIGEWPAYTETPRGGRRPPAVRKKNLMKLLLEENRS